MGPLIVMVLALVVDVLLIVYGSFNWTDGGWLIVIGASVVSPFILLLFNGLFAVPPNEARVLQLFGNYVGTIRSPGLRYTNPLYSKERISVRV